jgi:DNA repair protein RadC
MVELLRQREQERLQGCLSREELFTILVTWSVPVTHLTEIERRNRHRIVEDIHKQSAQQLIHAMFVGRKVRAMRQAANTNSKRKLFGATKFMMKTAKPVAPAATQEEDNFEEIECFRRLSSISKVPDKVAIAEEQDAFIRTCIRSRSQMISSKKLLEKVRSVQALLNDATSDTTHQTDACISDQARLHGFADETH